MYYLSAKVAALVLNVGYEGIKKAVKRDNGRYSYRYIKAKGRGGKRLLIGVSPAVIASSKRVIEREDGTLYDEKLQEVRLESIESVTLEPKIEEFEPSLAKYLLASPQQQERVLLKLDLINAYERRGSISSALFLQTLDSRFDSLEMSESKLFRWLRTIKKAKKEKKSPLVVMLDKRGNERGSTTLPQEMQEMAIRMRYRRDNPLRVSAIYRNMKHRYGEMMPSYDVINKFLHEFARKNGMLHDFAQGADDWKNKRMAAFGSLSEKALYPNHYWELDSTPADVITSDAKRWTVLCAIDVYSRRAVFWLDERSSAFSIARLLRKAILKLGIPENVVIDNGKDYKSNHFASICYNLGINQVTVPPFSGDMKPHVERIFRTLSSELFEEMEGYIGHSVGERERISSRKGFEHKLESQQQWHKEARKIKEKAFVKSFSLKEANAGLEIHLDIAHSKLDYWIQGWEELYENRKHGTLDCSPLQQWHKSSLPVKSISDRRLLDILLGESFQRKVGKKGIRLQGASYLHVKLAEYVGEHVRLMCTDDMGHIFVYTMEYKPICIAEDPEFLGKSREEYAGAKKLSKRIAREMNKMMIEWERYSQEHDPSIKDRIEEVAKTLGATLKKPVPAVTKSTEVINNIIHASEHFEALDEEAITQERENEGTTEELTPSGRPAFRQLKERFVWDLSHDMVDESTKKLSDKKPEVWRLACNEYEHKRAG